MNVKKAMLAASHHAGMFAIARHARRHALVIVTYHGVLPGHDDRDEFLLGNFVASSAFEWQMAWLCRHYTPVSLSHVVRSLDTGQPLPRLAVAVTFDDGFANNFRYAFPILRRHAIPATIFLTTGLIGVPGAQLWTERVKRAVFLTDRDRLPAVVPGQREWMLPDASRRASAARDVLDRLKRMPPTLRDRYVAEIERVCGRPALTADDGDRYDFLTWDEVRTMADEGIEFGSHTVSHPILSTLDTDHLEYELRESKRTLEDELQRECVTFAYPNGKAGDFGDREKQTLRANGYRVAFSLFGGINPSIADPFGVDRVNVTRGFYPALFDANLTGALGLGKTARARLKGLVSRA
jgi:peptidoglycan/xylan/chitin deacetylase (PgdA/CDA1 family)